MCAANTYSNAGASSCTACDSDYANSGTDSASHAGVTSCKVTCAAGTYVASSGAACTDVGSGYYRAGTETVSQTKTGTRNACTDLGAIYKASDAGRDASTDCYATTTAKSYVKTEKDATETSCPAGSYCPGSVKVYYNSTGGSTLCPAGKFCVAGVSAGTACALGSYTSTTGKSTCAACGSGKTTNGTGQTSCNATCDNASNVYSWASTSWSNNSVANLCKATACNENTYYTAKTETGYANTCTACGDNSSTAAGNTLATCACTQGYTHNGTVGGNSTSTSGCSLISGIVCDSGYYLPAQATACETCDAGYYCPSASKTYSWSKSIQGRTECSAGTYQPSTGKTSCIDASAGYYVPKTAQTGQTACTGATYQDATKQTSCKSCPSGYTANTDKAKTAISLCQISCEKGTRVATANGLCTTPSGNWYTTDTHLVKYGSKSQYSTCPTGTVTVTADMLEQGGLSSSNNGAESVKTTRVRFADYMPVSAGTYTIAISDSSVELLGVYVYDTSYAYETLMSGATYTFSEDKMIRAVFTYPDRNTNITVSNVVSAGVVISKQYSISGVEASNHDAQTDCQIVAPAGTYVASSGKMFQSCEAGTYKGASSTLSYGNTNSCSVCASNTYSDSGVASCAACATAKGYVNSGTTAASHAGVASCKVKCGAGQYVASAGAGCVDVGVDTSTKTGYWSAGGTVAQNATLARTKCATGLITIGYGTGANEADDCGRKLHMGANTIYLRSAKRGTPALNVKIGDKTFYGVLSTSLSSKAKVKNGTTTYSVVNDNQ